MFAGATMEDVEGDYDQGEGTGVIRNAKRSIKHGFNRAQEEARGMFERVRRSFSISSTGSKERKMNDASKPWPPLPFAEWQDTAVTLHMWTQIVGKIRLTLSPWINHSWHVTLYVTSRGLTTSPIPDGTSTFEICFDFIDHELRILKSDGAARMLKLRPQSVAKFYRELMNALAEMELPVTINVTPNEIENPIPFDQDEEHRSYDREYANRFWRVLVQSDRVFKEFRSRFCGKCSPVHFFVGQFRSGGHALFRAAGATASWWDPASA